MDILEEIITEYREGKSIRIIYVDGREEYCEYDNRGNLLYSNDGELKKSYQRLLLCDVIIYYYLVLFP